jgi:hypothetical protein
MAMHLTNNEPMTFIASTYEEEVHIDLQQKVWDEENQAPFSMRIGYLTLTIEQAEQLAKDLVEAAEKARDYDPDAVDEDEDDDA